MSTTVKEPTPATPKNRPGNAGLLEQLIQLARQHGWVMLPAAAAPLPLSNYIKPGNVADCMIVVAQNSPKAVDDAESVATTLCEAGGHFTTTVFTGTHNRIQYPVLITYLDK
jgi:hypothetical protein